jgi:hypothetical protein
MTVSVEFPVIRNVFISRIAEDSFVEWEKQIGHVPSADKCFAHGFVEEFVFDLECE